MGFIVKLNKEGRLIIIEKVKKELKKGQDFLSKDFFNDENIVVCDEKIPEVVNVHVRSVINSLPSNYGGSLGKWSKEDADVWLIAYTLYLNQDSLDSDGKFVILTGEKKDGRRLRIPFVAGKHNIKCLDIVDFFREEKLSFNL